MDSHMQSLLGAGQDVGELNMDPYEDLKEVLSTASGKRVFARLLLELGVGAPTWRPNSSIYRETALKDFGDNILAGIAEADEGIYIQLQVAIQASRRKSNGQ